MFRPFFFIIIFIIFGILLASMIKATLLFIIIALVSLLFAFLTGHKEIKKILLAVFIIFTAAFYYHIRLNLINGTIQKYAGEYQTVIGSIYDTSTAKEKTTYDVNILYVLEKDAYKKASGKIRITTLNQNNDNNGTKANNVNYKYGDLIEASGKLKIPNGKRNPGGMDSKAYLMQKGITCTMFSKKIRKLGIYKQNPFVKVAYNLRDKVICFYKDNLPDNLSSLLAGIVFGLKGGIPREVLRSFEESGALHFLAVSGTHVVIILGAIYYLLLNSYYLKNCSFIITSIFGLMYCFMAGLSPSVIRATIMFTIFMLGSYVGRRSDSINSLSLAATIILLLNPLNLFSISFQLSFAATLGIVLFFRYFRAALSEYSSLPAFLRDSVSVVISAQLLVWPFSAYYFNKVSLAGFISNSVIALLITPVLITGCFGGILSVCVPFVGKIVIKITGLMLFALEKITAFFSNIPFATVLIPSISIPFIVLYFAFLALSFDLLPLNNMSFKQKKTVLYFLILLMVITLLPLDTGFEVTFVDVGQGDCAFIRTDKGKTILIDGGGSPPYYTGSFDVGEDILKPFLNAKGINKIDYVMFSHFDDDHAKGLIPILGDMKVGCVIYGNPEQKSAVYKEVIDVIKANKIKAVRLARGDKFYVDNVFFEVYNPEKAEDTLRTPNDDSLVLRMIYNGISFLFTGDLGTDGEQSLLSQKDNINAHVLKVGHHGSGGSTSKDFLSAVKPVYGVISVGSENNYGHPSPRVINLLQESNVNILRTDRHGAITFKINKKGVKISTYVSERL